MWHFVKRAWAFWVDVGCIAVMMYAFAVWVRVTFQST